MSGGEVGVHIGGRTDRPTGGHRRHATGVFLICLALVMCVAPTAQAYQFSPETETACPACTTPSGQAQAAELTEGLAINGSQSETFGSTTALAGDATATSAEAAAGVGEVSEALLVAEPTTGMLAESSLVGPEGLLVGGALATGFVVGTAGRAAVIKLFGGNEDSEGTSNGQPWSNARWRLCSSDPCSTVLPSSASSSPPAIPRFSVYATWQDHWSNSTDVSATPTTWWVNCMGHTPPDEPCESYWDGGWGPQPGDLEGSHAVTVYNVGTSQRPGHVFTMSLKEFLARGPAPSIVNAGDANGTRWGSVGAGTFTLTQLLSALDAVIAANPDFGAWVQSQLAAHPIIPDCTGLSYEDCADQLEAEGLQPVKHTLSETNLDAGNGEVVDTDPAADEQPDPGTTVDVAVNPDQNVRNKRDKQCETGEGPQTDPGPSPSDGTPHPDYQIRAEFDSLDASAGLPPYPAMTVPLRYGNKQFGLRKIKLTHGYSASDAAETRLALETDPAPTPGWVSTNQRNFHYAYTVDLDGGGTLACERTVVVEYLPDKNGFFRGVQDSYQGALVDS
jgi:hypothetical protein